MENYPQPPLGVCSVEPQDSSGMAKTHLDCRGDVPALPAALGELSQVKLSTASEPEQQNNLWKAETVVSRKSIHVPWGVLDFP